MVQHKSQIFAAGSSNVYNTDEIFSGLRKQILKNSTKLLHFLLVEFHPKTTNNINKNQLLVDG